MYFSKMLYPVHTLGPGNRAALWLCGCRRRCKGCANPELQLFDTEKNITIYAIEQMIMSLPEIPDGFTITGGEPFEQVDELNELVSFLNTLSSDILIYSGYTYEQLLSFENHNAVSVLNNIAALVDGEYIEERNNGCRLKGSDNQCLYVFRRQYEEPYRRLDSGYDYDGRQTETFLCSSQGLVNVGFQKKGFISEFNRRLRDKYNRC